MAAVVVAFDMEKDYKTYCPECDKRTEYTTRQYFVTIKKNGIIFNTAECMAYCTECGCGVYVPRINDANALFREEAYRAAKK